MSSFIKQVHNVRIRVIDRDKKLIEEIFGKFLAKAQIETKQAKITYSSDEESDPLYIGELWLDHQQPVRKAVKLIVDELAQEDKKTIQENPEQFIDMATHCFLRLDKRALLADEMKLSTEGSTIQVRLNLAAFPAKKEKASQILQEIFVD